MEGITNPDIVVYLKPEKGTEDSAERKGFGIERYETKEIQRQVIKNFDILFTKDDDEKIKILEIDSSKTIEEVSKNIWEGIKDLI